LIDDFASLNAGFDKNMKICGHVAIVLANSAQAGRGHLNAERYLMDNIAHSIPIIESGCGKLS